MFDFCLGASDWNILSIVGRVFLFGNSVFFNFKHSAWTFKPSSTGTCWRVNSGHKNTISLLFFPSQRVLSLISQFTAFLICLLYLVLVQPVSCGFWPEECKCVVDIRVSSPFFYFGKNRIIDNKQKPVLPAGYFEI